MLKKQLRNQSKPSTPPGDSVQKTSEKAWRFIYLGDSKRQESLPPEPSGDDAGVAIPQSSAFPLCLAQPGDRLWISALKGDRTTVRQLQRLGLWDGTVVHVVSRQASGSLIIQVGSAQLGLGAAITPQIMVSSAKGR